MMGGLGGMTRCEETAGIGWGWILDCLVGDVGRRICCCETAVDGLMGALRDDCGGFVGGEIAEKG
jgi:hypothetical protein